jgi:hypothetical protein
VLIDVVRYKGGPLPEGYTITRADLEGALAKQKAEVLPGDVIIIRTGLVPSWYELDAMGRAAFFAKPMTGIGSDTVPWIHEKQVAGVAADNIALERIPNELDPELVVPLHGNLLRDLGVYIGEIWWLEELAKGRTLRLLPGGPAAPHPRCRRIAAQPDRGQVDSEARRGTDPRAQPLARLRARHARLDGGSPELHPAGGDWRGDAQRDRWRSGRVSARRLPAR